MNTIHFGKEAGRTRRLEGDEEERLLKHATTPLIKVLIQAAWRLAAASRSWWAFAGVIEVGSGRAVTADSQDEDQRAPRHPPDTEPVCGSRSASACTRRQRARTYRLRVRERIRSAGEILARQSGMARHL